MKFYGIDSEGRLRLPHISVLPTYDYTKHKRLVICQDLDDTIYVGTGDADGFWMALADSDEVISDTAEAINIHDEDESAHSFILNKLDTDLSAHDALATAHAPIRAEIDSDIATHDALSTAHPAIRAEIGSDIVTHNGDATAHPAAALSLHRLRQVSLRRHSAGAADDSGAVVPTARQPVRAGRSGFHGEPLQRRHAARD